ncbi:MAG TPA: hypothetical protein VJH20_05960 [Candidatus Nanoarchaeia archaeon]|nr:hypothetical protein [Candidatus Nanoarchaeia archaeon]
MKITKSSYDGKRLYELVLSRRDFDELCSGCPDGGFIVGRHADVHFHIFSGTNFSDAWRSMSDGYFLNVGVEAPVPPPNATSEEWNKSAQKFYDGLERAINERGRIPIEDEMVLFGERKIMNLGYVVVKVEPAPESD